MADECKCDKDSEAVEAAKVEKLEAETTKLLAESKAAKAEAKKAEAEASVYAIEADREEEKRNRELLADHHFHVYVFDSEVGPDSVKTCIKTLSQWARADKKCKIELQINSPGGAISSGFALYDFLKRLQNDGATVETVAYGMAASMGGVLLQAGSPRVMGANAFLLLHEGSLGAIGDVGEVEDRVKLMHLYHERILDIYESRAKPINKKTTSSWIKKNWKRTDWWLNAQKSLEYGFVDEIRG